MTGAPLLTIAAAIDQALDEGQTAAHVFDWLAREHGGRNRYAGGTYELRVARLKATCTAGGINLLRAWARKARAAS